MSTAMFGFARNAAALTPRLAMSAYTVASPSKAGQTGVMWGGPSGRPRGVRRPPAGGAGPPGAPPPLTAAPNDTLIAAAPCTNPLLSPPAPDPPQCPGGWRR